MKENIVNILEKYRQHSSVSSGEIVDVILKETRNFNPFSSMDLELILSKLDQISDEYENVKTWLDHLFSFSERLEKLEEKISILEEEKQKQKVTQTGIEDRIKLLINTTIDQKISQKFKEFK